jgi:hypothetical protein
MALDHFTNEAWIDFVRQVAPPEQVARMQEHLDAECGECRQAHRTWQTARQVIGRAEQFQCSENEVRSGRAAFADWRRRNLILPRARVARLISDNLLEPVPGGARANAAPTRRILHRVGSWAIDFRVEADRGTVQYLVGQLLKAGKKYSGTSDIEVLLMHGGNVVAKTNASARNLQMYFDIPGHEPIVVDLPDPQDASSGDAGGEPGQP